MDNIKMKSELTILFAPIDGVGHFNACIGLAEQLRDRGHKIVFATPIGWVGKLSPYGFFEKVYSTAPEGNGTEEEHTPWGDLAAQMEDTFGKSSLEQIKGFRRSILAEALKRIKILEPRLKKIVNEVKPHVIVVDVAFHQPSLMDSGIPWVLCISESPLGISNNNNVPPAFSGYPTDGDRADWEEFEKVHTEICKDLVNDFQAWVIENGGPDLKDCFPPVLKHSAFANIYMYPEELDYTNFRPNPPNFYQFDSFVRSSNESFELPEKIKNGPGKLVYFSMGTVGCSLLGMMKRIIGILGKSPHRFIVSKGPFADQIDLPENMWGAASLPQPQVIPLVDLVISHGGNNTVTETFYFGKSLLVLPLFCDQLDNGQRIFETGLGLQFNPCNVTEKELLDAVEKLLADDLLARRMTTISRRIQSSNTQSRAADVIEKVGLDGIKLK